MAFIALWELLSIIVIGVLAGGVIVAVFFVAGIDVVFKSLFRRQRKSRASKGRRL